MSDKVGNRKLGGLMAYLDSLVEKGRVKSSAVIPLKTAVRQIFDTVEKESWEDIDISSIDLDDYIARFKNLALDRYNADSYSTYKARANRAILWYKNFLDNPGWVPPVRKSPMSSGEKKQKPQTLTHKDAVKTSINERPSGISSSRSEEALISFPFPMSNGGIASLYLPKKITRSDADRLTKFISSLVIEDTDGNG